MPRVLIASHYTSESLGGEAAIPLRLYASLRRRGVETWLVAHDSNEDELRQIFADEPDRLRLTPSLPGMKPVFTLGEKLPDGPRAIAWAVTQMERQIRIAHTARRLVRELDIDVVHQPIGIGPSVPSPLTNLGAPLVVGPLNGGLSMPPAFRDRDSLLARSTQAARRPLGLAVHQLIRGKIQAPVVLVANDRTREFLPAKARRRAPWMPESAVLIGEWPAKEYPVHSPVRFIFVGRLVPYKSADLVIKAFARVVDQIDARLEIIGDGPMRAEVETLITDLGVRDRVDLIGWLKKPEISARLRASDVFVYPSLREPGGTVVLEAMASGLPSIVADWGGPQEYIVEGTGRRVDVSSPTAFLDGLVASMLELAADPALRESMGRAARERVASTYDWDVLAGQLVDIYAGLIPAP